MNALLFVVALVFTPDPAIYCDGYQACAVGNKVYLRGSPPSTQVFDLNPDLVRFPHFSSTDLHGWRQCGEAIEEQAGIEVTFNNLQVLCHEVKHVVYGRSHLQ